MRIGSVLSESWTLYSRFFVRFALVAGIVYLVLNLVAAIVGAATGPNLGTALLLAILGIVGAFWVQGALVETTVDVHDGRADLSLQDVFTRVQPVLGGLILAGVLAGLGIGIGLILFLVPGLFLLTRWALIVPVIVMEKRPALQAFGRSNQLVKGNSWRVLGLVVILVVGAAIAGGILSGILTAILGDFLGTWLGNTVVNAIVTPFWAIAITLVYLELSRHEA